MTRIAVLSIALVILALYVVGIWLICYAMQ